MKTIKDLRIAIESEKANSAWTRGVKQYALDLLVDVKEYAVFEGSPSDKRALLDGADDWSQFSEGGCSLIFDSEIAERLCTKSELNRKQGGDLQPNSRENWLEVQARALNQAYRMIVRLSK